ncbi:LAFE_0F07778g1_1 [Lachancea fermentati]|uniref:LAFE_0F07778g1_1 n=1 Tax=Lachancea fermentati TaxID=4955 RepID=A0A1G4MF55_LACFM|nr:LAFE_0F07778g1_1 [Lachancea fermentati]
MGGIQVNISVPSPVGGMSPLDGSPLLTNGNFKTQPTIKNQVISMIQTKRGLFRGEVQWCSNLSLNDWRTHYLAINETGELCHAVSKESVADLQKTAQSASTSNGAIIKHLQSCKLQLIDEVGLECSIIKVETYYNTIYLRVTDHSTFLELLSALLFWKSLKDRGIFNKCSVVQPIFPNQGKPVDLLVCQFNIYGPIPRNKHVHLLENYLPPPEPHISHNKADEGWFSAMGRLKSDGTLDLLLQSDGSLLYSINIPLLLRSEIQILDSSIFQNDNYLFLGIIPALRNQLGLSTNDTLFSNISRSQVGLQRFFLQFPLRIDLEDWYVALSSYAKLEMVSLIGTDKSNELRISNRFKISILEADFSGINLSKMNAETAKQEPPSLYAEVSIWGYPWARTSIVSSSNSPFWREEFNFNFSVKTSPVCICIRQADTANSVYHSSDKILGHIEVTQEMINETTLNVETRLPIFDAENKHFQLGTICIKIDSSLNFVLPSINFTKFESILSAMDLKSMTEYVYDPSISDILKLEDLSIVFLDIFQAIERENDWFHALIDKEMSKIDDSVLKNNNNNLSSAHIYNSLFRGNSILTKSVEKYCYRIGQEYLDKAIGNILRRIIKSGKCLELDPNRIKESDAGKKQQILDENFQNFSRCIEHLWRRIYLTSNDLPSGVKDQLKIFRKKLEIMRHGDDDVRSTINCISGFLFLRFFCPVILNPKLFNMVENHPSEASRRTLTLLTKVLLNLSTLTPFGQKEPWMIRMNDFISAHEEELLDYMDKVTEKKLDFSPKCLKLSDSVARPKLTMNKSILKELPSNPFLIDKYLRETELISVFAMTKQNVGLPESRSRSISMNRLSKDTSATLPTSPTDERIKIGELEFEKLSENNAEVFGDDLMKFLADEENESKGNGKLNSVSPKESRDLVKNLEQEASLLHHKIDHLTHVLSDYEFPSDIIIGKAEFADFLIESLYFDKDKNLKIDLHDTFAKKEGLKRVFTNTSSNIKFFNNGSQSLNDLNSMSQSEDEKIINQSVPKLRHSKSRKFSQIVRKAAGEPNQDGKGTNKFLRLFKKS